MFMVDMKPKCHLEKKKKICGMGELGFVSHTCAIVHRRHPVYVAIAAPGGLAQAASRCCSPTAGNGLSL